MTFATGVEASSFSGDLFDGIPPAIARPVINTDSGFALISWKKPSPTVPPAPGLNTELYVERSPSFFSDSLIAVDVCEYPPGLAGTTQSRFLSGLRSEYHQRSWPDAVP